MTLDQAEIDEYTTHDVRLVDSLTTTSGDTFERGLDSDSVVELQADDSFPEPPRHLRWTVGDDLARLTITYRLSELERKRDRQARYKRGPDDPSIEYMVARDAEWIVTSLSSDSKLRRALNVSSPDYRVEIKEQDSKVILNFVYEA